ncbi:MAG: hypothetical protein J6C41_01355 [Oscillospiraceae bacterium]|nr:hypothetical protein [Oscillospiraceae bacterium]
MKKRILALLLMVCLMLCIVGCGEKKSPENGEIRPDKVEIPEKRSNVMEYDEQIGEYYYLLGDFETYFECSQVKYTGGKMTQIRKAENPELVTYGEQSLMITVPAGESDVSLRMATDTAFFNETTDFYNLTKVSFDVYNAQSEVRSVRFYLNRFMRTATSDGTWNYAWEDIWHDDNQYSTSFRFDIEPGKWTHIEITAEEFAAKLQEDLSQIDAFIVAFEDGRLFDTDQSYYLDNVRVYIGEE